MAASPKSTPDVPLWQRLAALEAPLSLQQRAERFHARQAASAALARGYVPTPTETYLATSRDPYSRFYRMCQARQIDALGAPELNPALLDFLCPPEREELPPPSVVLHACTICQSMKPEWHVLLCVLSESIHRDETTQAWVHASVRDIAGILGVRGVDHGKSWVHEHIPLMRAYMQDQIRQLVGEG